VIPVRIITAISVIAVISACDRRADHSSRALDETEHADYRVRAMDELERLTASEDYVYLYFCAQMSGKRAAIIRSVDRQIQEQPAASFERIDTALRDSISQDLQSGALFPLEPGTRLKYLETPQMDLSEPILKLRVLEGEHRSRIVYYERHCIEHL
jgi:hypothetical protein